MQNCGKDAAPPWASARMTTFDPRNPTLLCYDRAAPLIGDAWLAQYRGRGWISQLIQYGTGGPHSHSALLRRNAASVDALELREFHGGRARPLCAQVAQYPGLIDVFAPNAFGLWSFTWNPSGAVECMERLIRLRYGYRSVIRIALRKTPLLWRFYPLETSDVAGNGRKSIRPFCSHAVALAYRRGGNVDCVPNLPDYLTTPNDLTHSMFFEYRFTLTP